MDLTLPPEFIVSGIWLWENFSKDIIKGLASSAKAKIAKEWEKFEWSLAAKQYRKRIYDLYSTMRVLGNPFPVSLEGIYTDVHILDKPTAFRRHSIEYLKASYSSLGYVDQLNKRKDALTLIRKEPKLFILGKPGAGKTTLLKYITLLAAKGIIDKVPIFVSLNDWSQHSQSNMSHHDLMSYIVRQFEICSFPDAQLFIEEVLLKKGRAIVLFDGLDEVNEEDQLRNQVTRILTDFTNQYADNTFIITCRVAAIDYAFEQFPYVEIADFTAEQIKIFVQKWFSTFPEKGQRFLSEISQSQNQGLCELARTPILLSLLCINYDETLTFPVRRNEIYQEAIDALLKKWDSSRNIKRDEIYRGLSAFRKRQLLSRIAAEYFEKGEIFFTTDDVSIRIHDYLQTLPEMHEQVVEGEVVLRAMEAQHGILVERARGIHSFSHLSLQEFFTSQYIVDYSSEKMMCQLMEHLLNTSWHEVFLMVAGSLPNADVFFSAFFIKQTSLLSDMHSIKKLRNSLLTSKQTPIQRIATLVITKDFAHRTSVKYRIRYVISTVKDLISANEDDRRVDVIKSTCMKLEKVVREIRRPQLSYPIVSQQAEALLWRIQIALGTREKIESFEEKTTLISGFFEQIQEHLEGIGKRRPLGNNTIALQIETKSVVDVLIEIQMYLESVLANFNELNEQLNTDIFDLKWHEALSVTTTEEFQRYLYLNQLFLECINVSAVSDRNTLITKNFLQ